ncbi:MAG: glycosyltransferase family 4 protein [Solirubrobacteraceae bacterium]|nr:glycosyltransferase family 4 protein [Solirubrobacteraceae bacterium]
MSILVLTARDWLHPQAGGSGLNLGEQVEWWSRWGVETQVISGAFPESKARLEDRGASIHRIASDKTVPIAAGAAGILGRMPSSDVILEVVSGAFFLSSVWARNRPRAVWLHHVHQDQYLREFGLAGKPAAFLGEKAPLRFLYRHQPFIVPSAGVRRDLARLGIDPRSVTVCHNGADHIEVPATPDASPSEQPTLVYVGRLRRYKRVDLLLTVIAEIPDARLLIAGRGEEEGALRDLADDLGIANRVSFLGFVSDEERAILLQRAWINVTASSAEGWGLTVIEAARYGTPSVAIAVGGLTEAIIDNETGLLAQSSKELTGQVRMLLDDAQLRERLGDAAKSRADRFTWEQTARTTIAILQQAITGARPRGR